MYGGCNMKCAMCLVHSGQGRLLEKPSKRVMPLEGFEKILAEAAEARPLLFTSLYGEPLAMPGFREKLTWMKRKGFNVICYTNGILCDEDLCRFFVEVELDALNFSLDAVRPETYRAIRRVDKLRQLEETVMTMLRVRDGSGKPRVSVSFTRQEANQDEEREFVERWRDVVDTVRVNAVLSNEGPIVRPYLPIPEKRFACQSLWNTLPVFYNGTAGLCCRDSFCDYNMGNVFEDSIETVWNGPRFRETRRLHEQGEWERIPLCAKCDLWADARHVEEQTETHLIRKSTHGVYYNALDKLDGWRKGLAR